MLMSAAEYRESLNRYTPRVFVDGQRIERVSVAPQLAPGIAEFLHDHAVIWTIT